MKDQILNEDFCRSLVEKLNDPFIQIKFNSVSAILNLILCYSEFDIDHIFLYNAGLLKYIENIFNTHVTNQQSGVKYSESELTKINKLFKITYDLLTLITELYDEAKDNEKLDFNTIIGHSVNFILNPGDLSEEVILSSCLYLSSILSTKCFKINDINNLNHFVEFSSKIVFDKNNKANILITASMISKHFIKILL